MLQIKLGQDRPAPDDPRERLGWYPGISEEEAWIRGREAWVFKSDRVLGESEVQIISPDGEILAVAEITGVSKRAGGRYAVDGTLRTGDSRVGTQTPHPHTSRNPVTYF